MEENKGWMHSQHVVWAKMPEIISRCEQELQSNGGYLSYKFFSGYTLHLVECQRVNALSVLLMQLKRNLEIAHLVKLPFCCHIR
jgi:hypothetical protein